MSERIVAVGLLTARDLEVLGTGFRRMFPLDQDAEFDDLLLAIDQAVARNAADNGASRPPLSRGSASK